MSKFNTDIYFCLQRWGDIYKRSYLRQAKHAYLTGISNTYKKFSSSTYSICKLHSWEVHWIQLYFVISFKYVTMNLEAHRQKLKEFRNINACISPYHLFHCTYEYHSDSTISLTFLPSLLLSPVSTSTRNCPGGVAQLTGVHTKRFWVRSPVGVQTGGNRSMSLSSPLLFSPLSPFLSL